jgi:hypothetical protein
MILSGSPKGKGRVLRISIRAAQVVRPTALPPKQARPRGAHAFPEQARPRVPALIGLALEGSLCGPETRRLSVCSQACIFAVVNVRYDLSPAVSPLPGTITMTLSSGPS